MTALRENASSVVARLRDGVALMGAVFDPGVLAATRELYRPHVCTAGTGGVNCTTDLRYGPDPRHVLDVYRPAGSVPAPIVAFVHGGAFVGGSKAEDGTFHRNVGEYFARHGFVALVHNYRLAPDHPWPAGAQDLGAMLRWAVAQAASFGGDPGRFCVIGQSAGASHVASWLFDPSLDGSAGPPLRAVALLSGYYRAAPPLPPPIRSYFGDDPAACARRSPIAHVTPGHPPVLLTVTEFDPGPLARQTFDMARELCDRDGRSPTFAWIPGHNHVSTVLSLGTPQDDVGAALRAFLERHLDPTAPPAADRPARGSPPPS
jgi:acetyl esterase/lipase